jgi:hypothetical protein
MPTRVLIYKRTHHGDPDHFGQFGINDCMGQVRARNFDAVIGVGGIGLEPRKAGIAGKVNWIGIGPHKRLGLRGPIVTFDHFLDFGEKGPDFTHLAPRLASHMYGQNVRAKNYDVNGKRDEVAGILRLAENAPPSKRLRKYGLWGGRMPSLAVAPKSLPAMRLLKCALIRCVRDREPTSCAGVRRRSAQLSGATYASARSGGK